MRVIRVANPSGLRANPTRKRKTTMATKRRRRRRNATRTTTRRAIARTSNPRRRRRVSRRNPTTIVTRATRRTINPRRRRRISRRHARRGNPSGLRIGDLAKKAIYGAGGAILTRAGASLVQGFIPSSFAVSPMAGPITQAAIAVIGVRWVGKKILGQAQADVMMIGGLISAGLSLFDAYLPNAQQRVTSIFQPILAAPQAQQPATLSGGFSDVYDVAVLPGSFGGGNAFAGLGDVEDVPMGIFS